VPGMERGENRRLGFLNEAIATINNVPEESIGFQARLWAQVALPYKDPGEVPVWKRRNGSVSLSVQPAVFRDARDNDVVGYPFGVIPRLLLVWMATEAVRTQERQLYLGPSLRQFTDQLGMGGSTGGRKGSITRLRDQIQRLAGARITVIDERITDGRRRSLMASIQVATEWDLWLTKSDDQQPLWPSSIKLSQEFFGSIIAAPLPIRLDHLAALRKMRGSGLAIDIYVWLASRMYTLRKPVTITWTDLAQQFGSDYCRTRAFAAQFRSQLALVQSVYTTLKVDVGSKGLTLHPSPTPIPAKTRPIRPRTASSPRQP
jgi:hypothetical protein